MEDRDTRELLDYLSGFITPRRRRRIEEVLSRRTRKITVVLEDVYQPHNASAILRTCECFGIQDVYVVERRNAYEINEDIALGASRWLTLYRHRELGTCVDQLRGRGYRLVATTPHEAECTLNEVDVDAPCAVLLGTEESGLSQAALEAVDLRMAVPILGFTESYNVSVCAALVLQQLVGRLHGDRGGWGLSAAEREALRLEWYRRSIRGVEHIEERFRQMRRRSDPFSGGME